MENKILSTKRFFESHHIILSDEWLESCIQWCHEESPKLNYTPEALHLKVYEQWLLLDLRDVEVPLLPANLAQQKKMVLNGNYSLQMIQVTDIARPKLWQLQKLQNKNNSTRTPFNHEDDTNNSVKRVLHLILTDGVQEVEAIEYKTINALHLHLSPGIKIKIMEPIMVRRGQLMLEEKNVIVLGGEVEELLITNAAENILASALNLPQNPHPNIVEEPNANINMNTENNLNSYNNIHNNDASSTYHNITNRPSASNINNNKNKVNACRSSIGGVNLDNISEDEELLIMKEVEDLLEAEGDIMQDQRRSGENNSRQLENNYCSMSVQKNQFKPDDSSVFGNMDVDAHLDLIDEQIELNDKNSTNVVSIIQLKLKNKSDLINNTFTIRAKFKNVVQKLTIVNDRWSLKVLIGDNDDDLEVFIADNIVSRLTGYSASSMLALKKDILNKNESVTATVMKALEGLKEKLLVLNCLMELKFSENEDCPTITDIK